MNLFKLSILGGILILAILVIRFFAKDRLPKKILWALWLIAIFRLLIPIEIPFAYSFYTMTEGMFFNESGQIQEPVMRENSKGKVGILEVDIIGELQKLNPYKPDKMAIRKGREGTIVGHFELTDKEGNDGEKKASFINKVEENSLFQKSSEGETELTKNPIYFAITMIWAIGFLTLFAFYLKHYFSHYKKFKEAREVEDEFIQNWLQEHPTFRKIRVKSTKYIHSSMTYGVLNPVILLPEDVESITDEDLDYILYHEYTHIRRFDALTKFILCFVTCLHWFNPLVWVMYIMFNRDIELICDECVILNFGEESRSQYAHSLIDMQEDVTSFCPNALLCSNFSKNAIEERIVSIMKTKKYRLITSLIGVLVVVLLAGCFATTKAPPKTDENQKEVSQNEEKIDDSKSMNDYVPKYHFVRYRSSYYNAAHFSKETVEWLDKVSYLLLDEEIMALSSCPYELIQLDRGEHARIKKEKSKPISNAFEKNFTDEELEKMKRTSMDEKITDMSIAEFQGKIFEEYSEKELLNILRLSKVSPLKSEEENKSVLAFMEEIFLPSIGDKWKRMNFQAGVGIKRMDRELQGRFMGVLLYHIKNPVNLKIRDMVERKEALMKELDEFFRNKEDFQFDYFYKKGSVFLHEIDEITKKYSDDSIEFKLLTSGQALEYSLYYEDDKDQNSVTDEDLKSLLALKPVNKRILLKEFHASLQNWKNEDANRSERVLKMVHSLSDVNPDYKIAKEEEDFIIDTVSLCDLELLKGISKTNSKMRISDYFFSKAFYSDFDKNSYPVFKLAFEYEIKDFENITLKEREEAVFGFIKSIEDDCLGMSYEEYAKLSAVQLAQKCMEFAKEHSSDKIKITIDEKDIESL